MDYCTLTSRDQMIIRLIPLETDLCGRRLKRFEFLRLGIVGDTDDRDLIEILETQDTKDTKTRFRFFDQGVQSAHSTTVSCRHSINFVHDKDSPVRNSNADGVELMEQLTIDMYRECVDYSTTMHPPIERRVVYVSGAFQQLLATNIAGIQFDYGVTFQLGTEMSASRLSDTRRPRN